MDNENKCCGTCYWHKKCCGEFQCFNESAEGFAIETAYDDGKIVKNGRSDDGAETIDNRGIEGNGRTASVVSG
mgnify:CR=1 FL=1